MSAIEKLALRSATYGGTPAALDEDRGSSIERARAQTMYRATLTADLLERGEAAEMATDGPEGCIRVVPRPLANTAFDFDCHAAAADFVRSEIVPMISDGVFDQEIAGLLGIGSTATTPPRPAGDRTLTLAAA